MVSPTAPNGVTGNYNNNNDNTNNKILKQVVTRGLLHYDSRREVECKEAEEAVKTALRKSCRTCAPYPLQLGTSRCFFSTVLVLRSRWEKMLP